jgi:hypothetical protein
VRNAYSADRARLLQGIADYEATHGYLPGIDEPDARYSLVEQLIDSEQRNAHFARLNSRDTDARAADPRLDEFDPLRASIIHRRAGNIDEAFWLAFYFVHFGKSLSHGWAYPRSIYGALDAPPDEWWTWERTSTDPTGFRYWLQDAQKSITERGGSFSNHRKYQSLDAWKPSGTGATFESYIEWVLSRGDDHEAMLASYHDPNPSEMFDRIYKGVGNVIGFGRTAQFDFMMAVTRLLLAPVEPGHSYLNGATGPLRGAKLLFEGDPGAQATSRVLQERLAEFSRVVGISGDVAEDAVCNWQKNPFAYVRFSG